MGHQAISFEQLLEEADDCAVDEESPTMYLYLSIGIMRLPRPLRVLFVGHENSQKGV